MRHFSLKTKLISLYLFLAVIPIIIISTFSLVTYTHDTKEIEDSLLNYSISQVSENIVSRLNVYKKLMAEIVTDQDIRNYIQYLTYEQISTSEYAILRNQLTSKFNTLAWRDPTVLGISFITPSLEAISFDRVSDYTTFSVPRWDNIEYRKAIYDSTYSGSPTNLKIFSPYGLKGAPGLANEMIYFTYPAADWVSQKVFGVFVIEVSSSVFYEVLNTSNSDSIFNNAVSPYSCITNSNNQIIISPTLSIIGEKKDSLNLEGITSSKSMNIQGTDLTVHLFLQRGTLQKFIDKFGSLVVFLTILVTTVFTMVIYAIVRHFSEKVNQIAAAMDSFGKNQQDVELNLDPNDEILYIVNGRFHQMTAKISSLLQELKEKNAEIAQQSDQRRRAEIKALQSQINPHFLYNALDRINWMAIDNDQTEISEMLNGLGSLLRYSVSNIDTMVPLVAELEWMKKYTFIQSKRFERKIDLVYRVTEEANDFPIYKMLLQPLVENSILHAMDDQMACLRIECAAEVLSDRRLRIMLSDNGIGMDKEQLEKIRSILSRREGLFPDSIGISNMANRLWLYYGNKSEISVESDLGGGTIFVIWIPYKEQGGEYT